MEKICERCGKKFDGLSWRRLCYSCMKEDNLEKTQAAIREGDEDNLYLDTFSDDYVICPFCGDATKFQYGCYEDCPEHYEEGFHDMICENCGKEFELEVMCSWSCETRKPEDDE